MLKGQNKNGITVLQRTKHFYSVNAFYSTIPVVHNCLNLKYKFEQTLSEDVKHPLTNVPTLPVLLPIVHRLTRHLYLKSLFKT